jgi:hypothetical protein
MKKRPLQVSLQVKQPSVVEVTVGDRVQLDRLLTAPDGFLAERHSELLVPGVTTLLLAKGHYFFKTLSPVQLRMIHGSADAALVENDKNQFPDTLHPGIGTLPAPSGRGDDRQGEAPSLTFEPLEIP